MAYGGTSAGTSGNYSQSFVQGSGKIRKFYGGRAVFGGGYTGSYVDTMDYVQITVLQNAVDFAELSEGREMEEACSDGVRGVWQGGGVPPEDVIDYVNIGVAANALDFV